jgi:hypothetical protein
VFPLAFELREYIQSRDAKKCLVIFSSKEWPKNVVNHQDDGVVLDKSFDEKMNLQADHNLRMPHAKRGISRRNFKKMLFEQLLGYEPPIISRAKLAYI